MKKARKLLLVVIMLISMLFSVSVSFAKASAPVISLEGKTLVIPAKYGSASVDVKGTILVPVKGFAEVLGSKVSFDKQAHANTITRPNGMKFTIRDGKKVIEAPYGILFMGAATVNKNGISYIPLESIANILGYNVQFQGEGSITAKLTKNINGIAGNYEKLYSIYGTSLKSENGLISATTADLDNDGIKELIYISENENRGEASPNLYVQKQNLLLAQKRLLDDFNIVGNRGSHSEIGLYRDENGNTCLGVVNRQFSAYSYDFYSDSLTVYKIVNGQLKITDSMVYRANSERSTNGTSEINGKEYKGKSKFSAYIKKYTRYQEIIEYQEFHKEDKTNTGTAVIKLAEQESSLWTAFLKKAVLTPAQKVRYGITKDLVGANLEENIDTSAMTRVGDSEGGTEYELPGKDGNVLFRVFANPGRLGSIIALNEADVWGVKIGNDGADKVTSIFGKGTATKNTAQRFMAPEGAVSSLYYHFGNNQIEFFIDKSGKTISAFIRAFEGSEPK